MRLLVRSLIGCALAVGAEAQVTVVYPPAPAPTSTVVLIGPDRPAPRTAEFREEFSPARRITYLIAFKDSVVRVADQYWVDGKTIYFLTTDHQRMTAPVNQVDRTLSMRLNSERNVAFHLPPEQAKTVLRAHIVRHTAITKRCYCRPAAPTSGRASRSSQGAASR
jgi:hypothetical protein